MPYVDFEIIHLGEDPTRSIKIGVDIPLEVRVVLIECLWDNINYMVVKSDQEEFQAPTPSTSVQESTTI